MHCIRGQRSHGTKSIRANIIEHVRSQPRTQALYSVLPHSMEERPWFRLVTWSSKIYIFNQHRCVNLGRGNQVLRRIRQSDRRSTQKPNGECFSSQNNHVSCRNLIRVLSMLNNFKELLNSSTSFLMVYWILVAFCDVKLYKSLQKCPV